MFNNGYENPLKQWSYQGKKPLNQCFLGVLYEPAMSKRCWFRKKLPGVERGGFRYEAPKQPELQ
jgi:hypothetical protein